MNAVVAPGNVEARTEELFRERFSANVQRIDRMFGWLMVGQWVFAIAIALLFSPYGWEGKERSLHLHVPIAVVLGGLLSSAPLFLIWKAPGSALTRYTVAAAQMLWSALLIHLSGGRIETHFHVFGSLAFLAFYRDWKVFIPATLVVAGDHLIRQIFYPESVFGVLSPESWRFLEHSFWVVFEDVFLLIACVAGVREMRSIAGQQARIETTEQLEREMQIAARIQTAILPKHPEVDGLEISAKMIPADDVGGDYYDVLAVPDGCWFGIGDVAGHGLVAGLAMLQAQSAIKALVKQDPSRSPRDVLAGVNRLLYDNVRVRLAQHEHMTMSLVRYRTTGEITVAGAHETIVICRAATGRCELHDPTGTWLGLVEDIDAVTQERTFHLAEGDLLVLFTDGITEAANAASEHFGIERLVHEIEQKHRNAVHEIRDHVLAKVAAWETKQYDDTTLLVIRHVGVARAAAA
jgi:hypothetical protein